MNAPIKQLENRVTTIEGQLLKITESIITIITIQKQRATQGGDLEMSTLLNQYFDSIKTGETSRLKYGEAACLRAFADWADRRGYHLGQTKGDNGAAIFCARCGEFIKPESTPNKPKGDR